MKRIKRYGLLVWAMMLSGLGSFAQSHEAKQLMLNVEKLSQLKNILSDMKKGYSMVAEGYKKVKDVASGNFSLHQVFLDGLLVVSPEVKKYRRVAGIISAQQQLLREYKAALKALRAALRRFSAPGSWNISRGSTDRFLTARCRTWRIWRW